MNFPMQPVVYDGNGTIRFAPNRIVEAVLESAIIDMNVIALMNVTDEERMQFAQLIGYSVSSYCDLSYVSDESADQAELRAEALRAGGKPVTELALLRAQVAELEARLAVRRAQPSTAEDWSAECPPGTPPTPGIEAAVEKAAYLLLARRGGTLADCRDAAAAVIGHGLEPQLAKQAELENRLAAPKIDPDLEKRARSVAERLGLVAEYEPAQGRRASHSSAEQQYQLIGYANPAQLDHWLTERDPTYLSMMTHYGPHRVAVFTLDGAVELARHGESPQLPGMVPEQQVGDVLRPAEVGADEREIALPDLNPHLHYSAEAVQRYARRAILADRDRAQLTEGAVPVGIVCRYQDALMRYEGATGATGAWGTGRKQPSVEKRAELVAASEALHNAIIAARSTALTTAGGRDELREALQLARPVVAVEAKRMVEAERQFPKGFCSKESVAALVAIDKVLSQPAQEQPE